MSITLDDANRLLKVAQAHDGRTIAEANIAAWFRTLFGLEYGDCAEAIHRHYAYSTDFVMPAHIRRSVEEWLAGTARGRGLDRESHCGRPSCQCTHTPPCDHGWIETAPPGPTSLAGGAPCPTCKPGRQQQDGESRQQWQARLQEQNAAWQRKQNVTA